MDFSVKTPTSSVSSKIAGYEREVKEPSDLPQSYGETCIVLLPRDPNWMFTYWEVTSQKFREVSQIYGEETIRNGKPTLRVHEANGHSLKDESPKGRECFASSASPPASNGGSAGSPHGGSVRFFDIPVTFDTDNWYVHVEIMGKSWFVELGLVTADGRFIMLARSNMVRLANGKVSDITDARWVSVRHEFEKLMELSGLERIGRGSAEIARMQAQRWEMLQAMAAVWASGQVASAAASAVARQKYIERARGFWLVADCEVIVYGATDPAAKVKVSGKDIKLNPDGTFSFRVALPDGLHKFPIEAESPDGVETRKIGINVSRETKAHKPIEKDSSLRSE